MNEQNKQIEVFKSLANTDIGDLDFFELLSKQNKEKVWKHNPIKVSIEDGIFIHNAEEIKSAVTDLVSFADKKIADAKTVDDVEAMKKQTNIIKDWLLGTRKQITEPFDKLKSAFTESEKSLSKIDFKTKIDALNEAVYKKRRASIIKELEHLINSSEYIKDEITMKHFESFIEIKKKIKVFDLNTKLELSATAKKQVKEQFELITEPLVKAKQLEQKTNTEHNNLAIQIAQINELDLDKKISAFEGMLHNVEMSFEVIQASAKASINTQIALAKTAIKVKEQEARQKQEADLDEPIMVQIRGINLQDESISSLENTLNLASQDRDRLKSDGLIVEANYILKNVENRISELKHQEILKQQQEAPQEIAQETQQEEITPKPIVEHTDSKFRLSEEDVQIVRLFAVEADTEDEAKEMMVEEFRFHLSMIELKRG